MYQTTDKDLWGWDYAKLHIFKLEYVTYKKHRL